MNGLADIDNFKVKYTHKRNDYSNFAPASVHLNSSCNVIRTNNETRGIVINDNGRRHISERISQEIEFRTHKKRIEQTRKSTEIPLFECKRHINEISHEHKPKNYLRTYHNTQRDIKEACYFPHPLWTTKRHILPNQSKMYNLESDMNRKQRINSKASLRNNIPEKSGGDKFYKQPDREPGFFNSGGLIPGSTIQLRDSSKPQLRKSELMTARPSNITLTKPLFITKVKMQHLNDEKNEVRALTVSTICFLSIFIYLNT